MNEEIANSVTHGFGALLSVAGLIALMLRAMHGSRWQVMTCAIYGVSLVLLYVSSTLFHALPGERAKRFFLLLDHISIYLVIAGTYTPIALVTLYGPWGWSLFGFVWTLAVGGILFRCLRGLHLGLASFAVYVLMGWCMLAAIRPLLHALPMRGVWWLLAGAVTYSIGIAFYKSKREYAHAVWHLFVVGGSVCHYLAVYRYVLT